MRNRPGRKGLKKMSADNGVYILKCKDQYRVAYTQGIDNISYSMADGYWENHKLVPTRVVQVFGDCKYTRNADTALQLAYRWCSRLPVCEYGINILTYNKTWKHIVEDARRYAVLELNCLKAKKQPDQYDECQMQELKKIIGNGQHF